MSYATNELRRAAIMLCLMAAGAFASPQAAAEPITTDNAPGRPVLLGLVVPGRSNAAFAPVPDNASSGIAAPADEAQRKQKERRAMMRKVAGASLCIILLLIIFVVFVMIYSRRTRVRYLKYYQRIKFNKIWDVWWQKTDKKDDRGKPRR